MTTNDVFTIDSYEPRPAFLTSTPQYIQTNFNTLPGIRSVYVNPMPIAPFNIAMSEADEKKKLRLQIIWAGITFVLMASMAVMIVLLTPYNVWSSWFSGTSTTTTTNRPTTTVPATTTNRPTTTVPTTTRSPTSTISTVTSSCPNGYVRTPSGLCVNLLTDFYNCGAIGRVCSMNYTSCSYGICSGAPGVLLVGGVSIPGWGGSVSTDDDYQLINAPFNICLYSTCTTTPIIQSNGCICLGSCNTSFTNGNLPSSAFAGATAFGYWDDLYIRANTSQTIYYGTTGTAPNRNLVFEYYTSHFSAPTLYYHFQIVFYENTPGLVRYYYYQASDGGSSSTIGVQSSGTGASMTYAVNQAYVVPVGSLSQTTPTLTLTFNTNTNTYTTSG